MHFIPHLPRPPLDELVQFFWSSESSGAVAIEGVQLPEAGVCVMFNLGGPQGVLSREGQTDWWCSRWVSGERLAPIHLVAPQGANLLGIHFRPGGARGFFDLPMTELSSRIVDLDLLWPNAAALHERLALEPSVRARFMILELELRGRLRRAASTSPLLAQEAIRRMAVAGPGMRIRDLAAALGLGERRLLRRFDAEVGLGPKALHRLLRFRRVIDLLGAVREPDWPSIALECGYFDQPHLIRDFRGFAGIPPESYLAQRSVDPHFATSVEGGHTP